MKTTSDFMNTGKRLDLPVGLKTLRSIHKKTTTRAADVHTCNHNTWVPRSVGKTAVEHGLTGL